jgi:MFS family permease
MAPAQGTSRELRATLRLLGTRRFGTFWTASLLSNIGTWAQQVAEPWLLLGLGASPFLIGLDSFAMNAPVWVLTLVGGVLADRSDRRRVIAVCQSLQMLCPTLIAVLLLTSSVRPALIIVLSLVVGITDALSMPSFQSIVPTIVPRKQIARGLALNSTQFNLSRILGPAIAGMLMASVGAIACFALSAASYIPFIGVALWILPRGVLAATPGEPWDRRHPFAGLRQIAMAPMLQGALLTVFTTGLLCSPLITFVPVLVTTGFGGNAAHFSTAVGAFGVGGLLGAIVLVAIPEAQDRRRWSSWLGAFYGVVVVLTALVPWFWGLVVLMVLAGAAMTVSNTSANSILQSETSPRLLGQAASLYLLAIHGGLSLGSLLTGLSVGLLGVRHALLLSGLVAVIAHVLVFRSWSRAGRSASIQSTPAGAS